MMCVESMKKVATANIDSDPETMKHMQQVKHESLHRRGKFKYKCVSAYDP